MTTGTFWGKATRLRIAAVAASLAGVLALTACSGDGGGGGGGEASAGPRTSASASADTGRTTGGGDGSTTATDGLEGSWLATTDGHAVALVITGTEAGLFATGGAVCSGTAGKESGVEKIRLACTDGNKERAEGTVDSVRKSSLEVTWEGGLGTETYTRSEGGQLPSGLPTASLGS